MGDKVKGSLLRGSPAVDEPPADHEDREANDESWPARGVI